MVPGRSDDDWVSDLYGAHRRAVYGWALRILHDPVEARDATQHVFLNAHRRRRQFRGDCHVRTWLYSITVRLCLNELRRRQRQARGLDAYARIAHDRSGPPDAGAVVDGLTVHQLIHRVPDTRTAMAAYLVYCEGMSHQEAAKIMNVPARTVGAHKLRFIKWARKILDGAEFEGGPTADPIGP